MKLFPKALWLIIGALMLGIFLVPKSLIYGAVQNFWSQFSSNTQRMVAVAITNVLFLPYYLWLRKKVHKKEKEKWDK